MATLFAQIVTPPKRADGARREFAPLSTALLHKFESCWLGDEINRHLCWEGAGRLIVALSDMLERTLQAYDTPTLNTLYLPEHGLLLAWLLSGLVRRSALLDSGNNVTGCRAESKEDCSCYQ